VMQANQSNYPEDKNSRQSPRAFTYAEVVELLPGFVLGALEPEEMLGVESYLERHQLLADQLADLEATTAQLAYLAPQAPLPSRAKVQLMQRVQADLGIERMRLRPGGALFPPRKGVAPIEMMPPRSVVRATPTRNWFSGIGRILVGVGAAAAVLLLAFVTTQLGGRVGQLRTELANTQQQLTQLQSMNQSLQQELQTEQIKVAALTTPQREIALAGTGPELQANGRLSIHNDTGVLVVRDLPPLPPEQTYQLWLIPPTGQGTPLDAGLVPVANPTAGTLTFTIPSAGRNFAMVGVSIEPAGGSDAPTGPIVLLGSAT